MGFLNINSLPHLVEKLSDGDNIKITENSHGNRVGTVIKKIVEKADDVTKAIEQEVINDGYSFKVGTGDVDVSADVEDGFGEIGIKGVTYQNLVSCDRNITVEGTKAWMNLQVNSSLVKPNTVYTLFFDVESISKGDNNYTPCIQVFSNNSQITNSSTDSFTFQTNSDTSFVTLRLLVNNAIESATICNAIFKDIVLIEGNVLNKLNSLSYFKDIVGVGDKSKNLFNKNKELTLSYETHKIEILSNGKNLFSNKDNFITGGGGFAQVIGESITLSSIGDANHKYLRVELPVGKKYTVTIDKRNTYSDGWGNTIVESATNDIVVGGIYRTIAKNINSSTEVSTLTFETSMPYVFIHIGRKTSDETFDQWFEKVLESFKTLQIEQNEQNTPFEPYLSDKTQILLDEPLMRLPNGVCDEITRDGKLIRRVGKVVLNGSENWYSNRVWSNGDYQASYIKVTDKLMGKEKFNFLCNRFAVTSQKLDSSGRIISECCFGEINNQVIYLTIKKEKLTSPDLTGFKQWLSQNPTTVYYELAKPIVTEIPAPYLRIFKDGHLTFNTLVAPESTHVVQLNKSSQIERSIREVQSLDGRVGKLESFYDDMMLETSHKLNLLTYDFEYTRKE